MHVAPGFAPCVPSLLNQLQLIELSPLARSTARVMEGRAASLEVGWAPQIGNLPLDSPLITGEATRLVGTGHEPFREGYLALSTTQSISSTMLLGIPDDPALRCRSRTLPPDSQDVDDLAHPVMFAGVQLVSPRTRG